MEDSSELALRRLHGRLNELLQEFGRVHFVPCTRPGCWTPAINAYWERKRITICVELAGVDQKSMKLCVFPREVRLSGRRAVPEPKAGARWVEETLALEIDHGPFERVVALPVDVDPRRARAEAQNGLVWIHLPIASGPKK